MDVAMHYWTREDLSQHNSARNPWFNIYDNGKTDIGFENEKMDRLSLQEKGMLALIRQWLCLHKNLTKTEREELIKLLTNEPAEKLNIKNAENCR
ncbi:MAG TPA: hypothetical protein VN611_13985 [Patescibacteria group bacterium]|nr:hypothetical protein [Patescibacteria group bacterium]